MTLRVRPLGPDNVADFYALHGTPPFEWCFCVAWEVPTWEGWGDRTADENRAVRDRLFAGGVHDGYLLYDGERVIGWCQCGPRDRWTKLVASYRLPPDPGVFAIGCLCVAPDRRRTGAARALLAGALADLAAKGVGRVQAFPRVGDRPDGEVWTGPARLFLDAGFARVGGSDGSPVLEKSLGR